MPAWAEHFERTLARLTEAKEAYEAAHTPESLKACNDACFAYLEALRPALGDEVLAFEYEQAFAEVTEAIARQDALQDARAAQSEQPDTSDESFLREGQASVAVAMRRCEAVHARVMARLEETARALRQQHGVEDDAGTDDHER